MCSREQKEIIRQAYPSLSLSCSFLFYISNGELIEQMPNTLKASLFDWVLGAASIQPLLI